MKSKKKKYDELYNTGIVNFIKKFFRDNNISISEEYYFLIADYVDAINDIRRNILINPIELLKRTNKCLKGIVEMDLDSIGLSSRSEKGRIQMDNSLNYHEKKFSFFRELTNVLQTSTDDEVEKMGFYDGNNGIFLTKGAAEYITTILYGISNNNSIDYDDIQLMDYHYNSNILNLLVRATDLSLFKVLGLIYKKNGRDVLEEIYDKFQGQTGKFNELMEELDQIYFIKDLLRNGYISHLNVDEPININILNRKKFKANLKIYSELMDKVEKELYQLYLKNHKLNYVLKNHGDIYDLLTTKKSKKEFLNVINQLKKESLKNNDGTIDLKKYINDGDSLEDNNEKFLKILDMSNDNLNINQNNFSWKKRVAEFLYKNDLFMNISFVENFVNNRLDTLPKSSDYFLNKKESNIISIDEKKNSREDNLEK